MSREALFREYEDIDRLLYGNLEHYCEKLVKIKPKDTEAGQVIVPFHWNSAQKYLHKVLERQYDEVGKVRAIILKGRQMGISTYVGARFYRKTAFDIGKVCYILTHEDAATTNLFGMVKRMHDNMPKDYRARDTSNNAKTLLFKDQESGYAVGTAQSTKGSGRSSTLQLFHGSEVAFWQNAQEHFSGVMQAIPNAQGTEIILESTANGVGGVFYDQWLKAEKGEGQFRPIFLPWYWMDEYRLEKPEGFQFSSEELEYQDLYKLDDEQIVWAHFKNVDELHGKPGRFSNLFHQEYPATPQIAFIASGENTLIDGKDVQRARDASLDPALQAKIPRVLGVDIALGGSDDTRIIDRKGRIAGKAINKTMDTKESSEIADRIALTVQDYPDIQIINVDASGGWGTGVIDCLKRYGYGHMVNAVQFGSKASDEALAINKRAEMWWNMREWFVDGGDIPDDETLHRHICAPNYRYDAHRRIVLEPKEEIKRRLKFSPDGGDALALTFAAPVYIPDDRPGQPQWLLDELQGNTNTDWMTR